MSKARKALLCALCCALTQFGVVQRLRAAAQPYPSKPISSFWRWRRKTLRGGSNLAPKEILQ